MELIALEEMEASNKEKHELQRDWKSSKKLPQSLFFLHLPGHQLPCVLYLQSSAGLLYRACLDTIISCFFGERTREAKKSRQTPCDTVDYLHRGFSWRAEFILKIKNRKSQPQSQFSASPRGPVAGSS